MIQIIPAIDIIDGKCVRLTRGEFNSQKIYDDDPVEIARKFEHAGIKYLHLVDLDGARKRKIVNWHTLEAISTHTNLKIDFGGGVQSDDDIELAFNSGAAQITAGSIAVKNPDSVKSWIDRFGAEKIILGADVKNGKIALSGWREQSAIDIMDHLQTYQTKGIHYVICTDIQKDGVLTGPSFQLYQNIKQNFPDLFLIASGGVHEISDIHKLNKMGVDGVIIGKALYENRIQLSELEPFLC